AHKLTILASIAFGIPLQFSKVYTEGITKISAEDISAAEYFGYRINHLGIAKDTGAGIELRVHPTLIPSEVLLANVNGGMNAVLVDGDSVGPTLYYGAGAGSEPPASTGVAADLAMSRALRLDQAESAPYLGFQSSALSTVKVLTIDDVVCPYYIRLHVHDKTGVMADITRLLSDHGISIEAMYQRDTLEDDDYVSIVLMTHAIKESDLQAALDKIAQLDSVGAEIMRIRVEALDGDA